MTDARVIPIEFGDDRRAQAVFAGPRLTATTLLQALGLTDPRPVLLVIGGAATMDPAVEPRLERLLERGAIRAAGETGATVLDGGTASGVMAVLGNAAAASDAIVPLVGVAPADRVTYPGDDRNLPDATTKLEPNHSHFVLAKSSEWGGETTLLFDLLDVLARDQPVAVLLAGGGTGALDEVDSAAQRGLPIVVMAGTGGLADALASGGRTADANLAGVADQLREVAAEAALIVVPLTADPLDLAHALRRLLKVDETLQDAWQQYSLVSGAAQRQQRGFRFEQTTILILGVALTTLVVVKVVLDGAGVLERYPMLDGWLHIVLVLVPITIATLAAAASRMRPGTRWVLLRGTSEGIKSEIFRYRTRAGKYSHSQTRQKSREVKLAQAVGSAMGALMRTDVNLLALDPTAGATQTVKAKAAADNVPEPAPDPAADKKVTPLSPEGYLRYRINDQIQWYTRRVRELERQARTLRWLALGFGAMGTFLAAIGLEIWVAVTTALVGAYTTYLESWQLETAVTLYNQAATDLSSIRAWWVALSPADQSRQETTDRLVDQAERIMRAEHTGWVQEMQDAMTQLRLEQAGEATSNGTGRPEDDSQGEPESEPAPRARRGAAAARVGRTIGGRRGRDGGTDTP